MPDETVDRVAEVERRVEALERRLDAQAKIVAYLSEQIAANDGPKG